MTTKEYTFWYGVCDRCGAEDDDGRPTALEAQERMWRGTSPTGAPQDLCWDCVEAEDSSTESSSSSS